MSQTLSDLKHIMSSRDTTVYIFKDKKIVIENSLIQGGKLETFNVERAKGILMSAMSMGDEVPIGVFDELDKL